MAGKGDKPRPINYNNWNNSPLWCKHGKMKDKCVACKSSKGKGK